MLVENIPDRQRPDNDVILAEVAVDLAQGVLAVIEGHEETLGPPGAAHGGLERVEVSYL